MVRCLSLGASGRTPADLPRGEIDGESQISLNMFVAAEPFDLGRRAEGFWTLAQVHGQVILREQSRLLGSFREVAIPDITLELLEQRRADAIMFRRAG